jgi:putative transposase
MIGVDLGVVRFVTTSEGEVFAPFNNSRKLAKKLRKLQKSPLRKYEVAKKRKKIAAKWAKEKKNGRPQVMFGKKDQKVRTKLAKHHKRIADLRKDNVEKASTSLSKNHALVMVVVEDLKVKNRSATASGTLENPGRNVKAKSGLPKAILNQGWGISRERVL